MLKAEFTKHAIDGKLTREGFKQVFPDLQKFPILADHAFNHIFDKNEDKAINYQELCVMLARLIVSKSAEKLSALFELFDLNQDGVLEMNEIREML